ncbi:MAG: outer membrane lipid asymmetry maintenance protein MlaD [Desulfarculus sp.]|nr:outer membrane lipid asymmetry maintenance protein MlaD [Desulfarculus sp.]
MKRDNIELSVGIFVLIGLLAVGYMAVKLGKVDLMGDNTYLLKARFQSVSGLKTDARVEVAGVEVGKVAAIHLDSETMAAMVDLKIRQGLKLTVDTIASVRTSGLIGDKFVKLSPGGMPTNLAPGETITDTESPLEIEELIGKYVFGGVDSKGGGKGPEKDGEKSGEKK